MAIDEFDRKLQTYLFDISKAHSESTKAFLFLEFIRSTFSSKINLPQKLYPVLEKQIKSNKTLIVKGRIDAFLGNIIIEFDIILFKNSKQINCHSLNVEIKR